MDPINEEGDVFEMDGLFAEFWFNLQVSINSIVTILYKIIIMLNFYFAF